MGVKVSLLILPSQRAGLREELLLDEGMWYIQKIYQVNHF